MPKTLFGKIRDRHVVRELGDGFALLFVDRHVIPEVAHIRFGTLKERVLPLKHPEYTSVMANHTVPALWATRDRPDDRRNGWTRAFHAAAKGRAPWIYGVDPA